MCVGLVHMICFVKQKTAYEMRISDWSSDVCSSDLPILGRDAKRERLRALAERRGIPLASTMAVGDGANDLDMLAEAGIGVARSEERRVGKECGSTCRSRWSPEH